MNYKLILKKVLFISYIICVLGMIISGVYDYISDIKMGLNYWVTFFMLLINILIFFKLKNEIKQTKKKLNFV